MAIDEPALCIQPAFRASSEVTPVLLCSDCLITSLSFPDAAGLERLAARFAPTPLEVDTTHLSEGDEQALLMLIRAAQVMDEIFLDQLWSGNRRLHRQLETDSSALGRARLRSFWLHKGPWSGLDDHAAFLPDVPARKPLGANFYPEDLTRDEFEQWANSLTTKDAQRARGFYSVIRRNPAGQLAAVAYSTEYRVHLEHAADLLRHAARLTTSSSLSHFLEKRAEAFLTNDYLESDLAWMKIEAPLDITIGPYETYNDELFGYKAGFEAYICLKDEGESARLRDFAKHLQRVEDNLPIEPQLRNPKLAASTPISVVNEVLAAGDACHGVQTAAFNLPNDERVILRKGSKKVLLKNVQQAKFAAILTPIAAMVLAPEARRHLSFEWFFTHILAHEISHGIGPQEVHLNGRATAVRRELKELYSPLEEVKADITGLFMLQLFFDKGILPGGAEAESRLYTTFLASGFRTLRFGVHEAHGRGMAVQMNYLLQQGGFVARSDGYFEVNLDKIKEGVRRLTGEVLTLEATGDYDGAERILTRLGTLTPPLRRVLDRLDQIPVDIAPQFITAARLVPEAGRRV